MVRDGTAHGGTLRPTATFFAFACLLELLLQGKFSAGDAANFSNELLRSTAEIFWEGLHSELEGN